MVTPVFPLRSISSSLSSSLVGTSPRSSAVSPITCACGRGGGKCLVFRIRSRSCERRRRRRREFRVRRGELRPRTSKFNYMNLWKVWINNEWIQQSLTTFPRGHYPHVGGRGQGEDEAAPEAGDGVEGRRQQQEQHSRLQAEGHGGVKLYWGTLHTYTSDFSPSTNNSTVPYRWPKSELDLIQLATGLVKYVYLHEIDNRLGESALDICTAHRCSSYHVQDSTECKPEAILKRLFSYLQFPYGHGKRYEWWIVVHCPLHLPAKIM